LSTAFAWGALAASSLLLGGVIALVFRVSGRVLGLILGFGAGVLISAVAYELVEDAFSTSEGGAWVAAGLAAGALVYFVGDELIDRRGGEKRKSMGGEQEEGTALAIVLGIVLDGIPESVVIGLTLLVDGLHQHIPKGYVYFAMAFSVGVEMLNIRMRKRAARPVGLHERYAKDPE